MLSYYKQFPLGELRMSERNQQLYGELLAAHKTYSTLNAEISMNSYNETQNDLVILRKAKALTALFTQMPIYIRERELLVGNRSEGLGVMPRLPEYIHTPDNPRLADNDARYEAVGLYENFRSRISAETDAMQKCLYVGYPAGSTGGFGHILADYDMVMRYGALELAERAEAQAEQFRQDGETEKESFCKASAIACRAFAQWGCRYGSLAEEIALNCKEEQRKEELLRIAEVCHRVPAYPARNFREALQAMFFTHQAMSIEQQGGSISIGGFDRVLESYYINDIESGEMTVGIAEELIEAFYIKLMENAIWPRDVVNFCNMSVGGCKADGNDASNDLTWMALDTTVKTKSTHPLLSFRWHPSVDRGLWLRVIEIVGTGNGLPALFSDIQMIGALESWGFDRPTASSYGVVGCVEPALNGLLHGQTLGGHVNLLMCLELAFNNGRRILTGEQMGPDTGILSSFTSMEQIFTAYERQVEYACEINRDCVFATAAAQREHYGYPLMSSLMHGALERGQDLTNGVAYNFPTVCITGVTNVVNSLLALQELVFTQERYTLHDFYSAMRNNYEGFLELRERILSCDQYFGNGEPSVVAIYNKVCEVHTSILRTQPGPRGGYFMPGLWPTTWHVRQGAYTAASPDGRKAGEPIADGAGPVSRRTGYAPTAIIRDMAGVDAVRHWPGGYVFNMKFSENLFKNDNSLVKMADFIAAFLSMGGMQMQVNVHSKEVLTAARNEPDKYRDLVVRVAGFSAYFTSLDSAVQDEIISRAEVSL